MLEKLIPILMFAFFALSILGLFALSRYVVQAGKKTCHRPYIQYYSVPMSKDVLLRTLAQPMYFDDWQTKYFPEDNLLVFQRQSGLASRQYELIVTDMGHFSVVSLGMMNIGMRGLYVDPDVFMAEKFGAVPIPNEQMHPHL